MARIRVSGASGSSENTIIFIPSGGHSHDGVTSSLISTEKYSIYDFSPSFVNSTQSQTRAIRQENNRLAFESLVVNIVNQSVLVPAGIRLNPGTLNASAIIANTITATHIAANTITADEIAANTITTNQIAANTITAGDIAANTITADQIASNTITADELVSNVVLVNNIIRSNNYTAGTGGTGGAGWKISNDGSAEFSNVVVRGNIYSNVGTIGGWALSGTSLASGTGSTTLYSNGAAVIGNTTIAANGQINNGTNFVMSNTGILTANSVNISGAITATSGSFTGAVTATSGSFTGSITSTAGTIGGWTLASDAIYTGTKTASGSYTASTGHMTIGSDGHISANKFRVNSDGSLFATGANIAGVITSTSGTIGGWTLSSNSINSGNTYLYSNGAITNGNFAVSNTGVLTATGASFSGTITGTTTATADLFIRESIPAANRHYLTYLLGDFVQIQRTQSDYSTITGSGAFLGYLNASVVADDATMIVNSANPYQSGNYVQAKSDGTLTATGEISKRDSTRVRARISNDSLLFWDAAGAQKSEYSATGFYVDSGTVVGVFSAGTKYFRIQHPSDDEKMLVHSSLEGPTTDVFYRGESQLTDGIAEIELPNYFEHLTLEDNRTVIVTPIVSEDNIHCCTMACTRISDGRFKVIKTDDSDVYNQKFSWVVLATRKDSSFDVEPLKNARDLGN